MGKTIMVFCTFPDAEQASAAASALVEESLAACVNIIPGLRSIYRWQGKVHDDAEVMTIIKTSEARFPALEERLAALHPYDCPEILGLDVSAGHAPYLRWVADMVGR